MICKSCKREIAENSIFCNWCGARQIKEADAVKVPAPTVTASGMYYGRVMAPNGARISITEKTEKLYYKKAAAIKSGALEVKKTAPGKSLGAVIDKFIKDNEPVLSPSTVRGYVFTAKRLAEWRDKEAGKLDGQKVINALTAKYSPKTVKNTWGLISAALEYNKLEVPAVRLPAAAPKEEDFLDYEQILKFLSSLYGKPYELAALLALHGLRQSEILALNKDSIQDGVIKVRGAVVRDKSGKMVYKPTNKNKSSTRDVPVMIPRLAELWEPLEEITFPHPSNILDGIKLTCKKAGLPECSIHDLRRSFASLGHHLGMDQMTIQKLGGWNNAETLNKVYTKLSEKDRAADIQKMANFYGAES